MENATLDDFMSWNDQLAAAIEAGIPLDLGFKKSGASAIAMLEKINAIVARRTSQGATLADAIKADDRAMPPAYRALMLLNLASGTPVTGLDLSHRLAQKVDKAWDVGRLALIYPAAIVCLAFLGIIGFCVYFVPVLQSTYQNLGIKSGGGLQVLELLRVTMPYWAVIVPFGLIAVAVGVRRAAKSPGQNRRLPRIDWLPGFSGALFEERAANFAETLAKLLESGATLPEALPVVASVWNDRDLFHLTHALASQTNQTTAPAAAGDLGLRLPPFLRWALFDSETTTGRVGALRAAANFYGQAAERRQKRLKVIVPLMLAVLIGGAATLLYGLALFVPVVEILRGLASQYAA